MTMPTRPSRPYRPRQDEIAAAFRLYLSQRASFDDEHRRAVEACEMIAEAGLDYLKITDDKPGAARIVAYHDGLEAAAGALHSERCAAAAARLMLELDELGGLVQP